MRLIFCENLVKVGRLKVEKSEERVKDKINSSDELFQNGNNSVIFHLFFANTLSVHL